MKPVLLGAHRGFHCHYTRPNDEIRRQKHVSERSVMAENKLLCFHHSSSGETKLNKSKESHACLGGELQIDVLCTYFRMGLRQARS